MTKDVFEILSVAAQMHGLSFDEVSKVWDVETLTEDEAIEKYGADELRKIDSDAVLMGHDWYRTAKENARRLNLESLLYALEDATIFLSRLNLDESDDYSAIKEMIKKYTKMED